MINSLFKLIFSLTFFTLYLILCHTSQLYAQEQKDIKQNIISKGDEWSYHDENYLDNKDWIEQQFLPVSDWKTGKAPLGYSMDDLGTIIGFGKDSVNKTLTSYYHKTFFIERASDFYAYNLNIRRDDGAIVYLNGKEVWRTNMPNINKIENTTKAAERVEGSSEHEFHNKVLFPNNFLNGINIIAVEIHQIKGRTSDCVFDLELSGTNDISYLKAFLSNQDNQNIELKNEIKDLNYKIEIEKQDKELNSLKTRKTIIDIILIIAIVVLLIGAIFIILLIKDKIKAKDNIRDLKESVMLKEKELLNLSLTNIQSKQQLELIHEDLNAIIKKNETLDNKNVVSGLKTLNKMIDQNLNQEDEWLELQRHFNLVHSGFFDRLNKEYPSLAQSELRHCSLIKLHLSTKEIAKYLHVSPKSVQASRYRIKKKMQLDESEDLKSYLLNY
ncbi:LuxR C-terminal-related transcriptional regulator [Flavivirga aquimarina]|uniref:LuxR C-terminal-related transcriptional regulator n=1 Tax=Flavivirga aquimarina TaxID=2027862 RepID=A0ABT8W579_9FLAO|nr:LuxR C-terminal-related transcriptional regulator [Flavivirga aquimarina]MDO5968269.1 LuxR C-terminal-related transcriptional regulator [Flavivirga aquimarina]